MGRTLLALRRVCGIGSGLLPLRRELLIPWLRRYRDVGALASTGTAGDDRRHRDVRNLNGPDFCAHDASDRTENESEGTGNGWDEPAVWGPNMTTASDAPAVRPAPPAVHSRRH